MQQVSQTSKDTMLDSLRQDAENASASPVAMLAFAEALAARAEYAEAERWMHNALSLQPDYAEALAALGNIYVVYAQQQGRAPALCEKAVEYSRKALEYKPDMAVAWLNLGVAYRMQGKIDQAVAALKKALGIAPDHVMALRWLGVLFVEQKNPAAAIECFKRAVKIAPGLHDLWLKLGLLYAEQSRLQENPGMLDKAIICLENAVKLVPNDAESLLHLGQALLHREKRRDALACLERAANIAPDNALIQYRLGSAYSALGAFTEAIPHLSEAIRLNPKQQEVYAALAFVQDQVNKKEDALHTIDSGLALDATDPMLLLARGRIRRQGKDFSGAIVDYEAALASERLSKKEFGFAQIEKGKALESLQRYDEAFVSFGEAQALLSQTFSAKQYNPESIRNVIRSCMAWFTENTMCEWPQTPPEDGVSAPVFLIGFPRSGTTLMEQILASHPNVKATLEQPFIDRLISNLPKLLGKDLRYPQVLADLNVQEVRLLRNVYKEMLSDFFGDTLDKCVVVDKQPLNLLHVGLIQRLFPEARLVMMIRDPRDVVISCFANAFQPNPGMVNFYSIKSAAEFYNLAMGLWLQYRSLMSLECIEVRYESLVANLRQEISDVLEFLDLPWSDEVLRYYVKEKNRAVATPSSEGVMQPAYDTSIGRWRNYAKYLAPEADCLEPYATLFGYSPLKEALS